MRNLVATACLLMVLGTVALSCAEAPPEGKNLCLLYGDGCPPQQDTVAVRLRRLDAEIAKGEATYSPEELNVLKRKLQDAKQTNRMLYIHTH